MRAPALAETASQLPWLCPCADALLALARGPASAAWARVRLDPAAVLLLLRQTAESHQATSLVDFPLWTQDPAVLEGALHFLSIHTSDAAVVGPTSPATFVDWRLPELAPIYESSLLLARLARLVAEFTGRCHPDQAWSAGLLANLGWLAVCAVAPAKVVDCRNDADFPRDPFGIQLRHWGMDQAGIARRLCRIWQLPRWLAIVPSYLGLPATTITNLGTNAELFQTIQLAVRLAQDRARVRSCSAMSDDTAGLLLAMPVGNSVENSAAALQVSLADLDLLWERLVAETSARSAAPFSENEIGGAALKWEPPSSHALLPDMLRLAAENRRLSHTVALARLEQDVDSLRQTLEAQLASESHRLLEQKLAALAEFAAGAGHEINNPLAVISGQAQYLLKFDVENESPENGTLVNGEGENGVALAARRSAITPQARQKSLHTIIGQTKRIHSLLGDLMQFARPAKPHKQPVDAPGMIREVASSLEPLATQSQVRLLLPDATQFVMVQVDPQQTTTALYCLLKNAIEAAPPEGWAAVRLESRVPDRLEIIVEDNGTGPSANQREHLFDPFYSGRSAGRGRGLGLPMAWRLAREQGGSLHFEYLPGGPTRFVLRVPCN